MNPKAVKVIESATVALAIPLKIHVPWAGGKGWIIAAGSFPTESVIQFIAVSGDPDGTTVPLPGLPDASGVPGAIGANGTYSFEAPEGVLKIYAFSGESEALEITNLTLVDVNP